ncbi:MAG TPA: gluconate 2-dehydrogenase subunit 3 family protein [Gemmatimonadaceae bacterium]|nr:gluconate 2-dehydrogenase subunit 3 family protein [Gemmatimonadaceae bacterium]
MPLFPALRAPFRAIASIVVPEARSLTPADWEDVERIVDQAVSQRPSSVQRQLATFIRIVDKMPVARFGRSFTALDDARRARVLHSLENAPVLLVRRGFWGLRTLVFMGYYARPSVAAAIGYRASPRGWTAESRR